MGLSKLVLGAALAGVGCATLPKPVCDYQQMRGYCVSKYDDAVVTYFVGAEESTPVCSINTVYPEKKFGFLVSDVGCDGISDLYVDYKISDSNAGNKEKLNIISIRTRDKMNPESRKFFSGYDELFGNEIFQELKRKVLGGNEDGSK